MASLTCARRGHSARPFLGTSWIRALAVRAGPSAAPEPSTLMSVEETTASRGLFSCSSMRCNGGSIRAGVAVVQEFRRRHWRRPPSASEHPSRRVGWHQLHISVGTSIEVEAKGDHMSQRRHEAERGEEGGVQHTRHTTTHNHTQHTQHTHNHTQHTQHTQPHTTTHNHTQPHTTHTTTHNHTQPHTTTHNHTHPHTTTHNHTQPHTTTHNHTQPHTITPNAQHTMHNAQ